MGSWADRVADGSVVVCTAADYTFYLPTACALALCDVTDDAAYAEARV